MEYWPKPKSPRIRDFASTVTAEMVEAKLNGLFRGGYAVLTTSGRAAIALALNILEVSRSDYVQTFPYASSCVLNTISRQATPTRFDFNNYDDVVLAYHQWGWFSNNIPRGRALIEDCVDTLCAPGSQLFQLGGSFEIWSAPKVFGSNFGGVLWCARYSDFKKAKSILNEHGVDILNPILRRLGMHSETAYKVWEAREATQAAPSNLVASEVLAGIENIHTLIHHKKDLLEFIEKSCLFDFNIVNGRYPSMIPFSYSVSETEIVNEKFSHLIRHYTNQNSLSKRFPKVLCLPIHHQVDIKDINSFISKLKRYGIKPVVIR